VSDILFWRGRFRGLGLHSVGPGDTKTEAALESHRLAFQAVLSPWLDRLKGPVLDFGCGVGRWVNDLPKPYIGLDLLEEHLDVCRGRWTTEDTQFRSSTDLASIPTHSVGSIFTCTVLQHIVRRGERRKVLKEFARIVKPGGVILITEWAQGQRDYDWCTAVTHQEVGRHLSLERVGEVAEFGRRHTVWFGGPLQKPRSRIRRALK